jgi:hypothetical protein
MEPLLRAADHDLRVVDPHRVGTRAEHEAAAASATVLVVLFMGSFP